MLAQEAQGERAVLANCAQNSGEGGPCADPNNTAELRGSTIDLTGAPSAAAARAPVLVVALEVFPELFPALPLAPDPCLLWLCYHMPRLPLGYSGSCKEIMPIWLLLRGSF